MHDNNVIETLYPSSYLELILFIVVSLCCLIINAKVVKDLDEDDNMSRRRNGNGIAMKYAMETYSKTSMWFVPMLLISTWIINRNWAFPSWFSYLSCYAKYFFPALTIYLGFTSLVIATMRYTFTVHHRWVLSYGYEKTKRAFYILSIALPLTLSFIIWCTAESLHGASISPWQLRCIDYYCQAMNHTNAENTTRIPENYSIPCLQREPTPLPPYFTSPIYSFVSRYAPRDITHGIEIFARIVMYIALSNVLEGFLYWKTFRYMKRLVKMKPAMSYN